MIDSFHFRDYTEHIYSIPELKTIISSVMKDHPVDKAYLFGAYAHGTPRVDSDVDVAVCLSPGVRLTECLFLYDPLIRALLKSVDVYDVREFKDLTFMEGAIEIYDRNK